MMEQDRVSPPLTERQRERVAANLGLVGSCVQRYIQRGPRPFWRSRGDELFQEGCLGLIQAARNYDDHSGMSFATYAVPRIRYAVSRAMQRCRQPIRLPERWARMPPRASKSGDPYEGENGAVPAGDDSAAHHRAGPTEHETRRVEDREASRPKGKPGPFSARAGGKIGRSGPDDALVIPQVRSWGPELMEQLAVRAGGVGGAGPGEMGEESAVGGEKTDTVGGLLRHKLEVAVREAVARMSAGAGTRRDRGPLVRLLAEHRVLVPDPTYRRPLRQIARDTASSYGRVADCESSLLATVRRVLSDDVEFRFLRDVGMLHPDGMRAPVRGVLRQALRRTVIEHLGRCFVEQPPEGQARWLLAVLQRAKVDPVAVLRAQLPRLNDEERSALLGELNDLTAEAAPVPVSSGAGQSRHKRASTRRPSLRQ